VPEPAQQPESTPQAAESVEPDLTNVAVLESSCKLPEHRPIVDSKCGFCRKLWQERQRANEDELLRVQRPPQVVT
jgi:hypothetical protein